MSHEKQQHVDFHRKLALRRQLIKYAVPGAAYLPYCGDGDIARALYYRNGKVTKLFAADLDPARVASFIKQCPESLTATGDCDRWPFADDVPDAFAIADFDAYAYPYDSFRAFWNFAELSQNHSRLADRLILFFTDGQRLTIRKGPGSRGTFHHPDGRKLKASSMNWNQTRSIFNFYLKQVCVPWLASVVTPENWTINTTKSYLRDSMIYWGSVITRG